MSTAPVLSFEFFPPRTPEGVDKLRAARRQLAQLAPAFCSVTFGAGGSTREGTLDDGARDPRRGPRGRAAPLVHRRHPRVLRDVLAQYRGARHPAPRRAARRPSVGHGGRGRIPLRERARRVHPRGDGRLVPHRRRLLSRNSIRRRARPRRTSTHFERKIDAGANSAITQYFFNADAYWRFVDALRRARHRHSDRARRHADRELHQARALLRRLRRRNSALDPAQAGGLRRRHGVDSRVRPRRRDATLRRRSSRTARRACTSTR